MRCTSLHQGGQDAALKPAHCGAGHDHVYERTCPVYKEICQPANADGSNSAPVYVVIGNAGALLHHRLTQMLTQAVGVCGQAPPECVNIFVGAGYELSWFYNPFYPNYWESIAIEHGYSRCEVSTAFHAF